MHLPTHNKTHTKQQCNLLINTKTYVQHSESCVQQNKSQESLHNDHHRMQDFWRLEATAQLTALSTDSLKHYKQLTCHMRSAPLEKTH